MDRKWKSGAAVAPPALDNASDGYATAGDPGSGTPATKPGPHWYHMVTEEILSVLAAAAIAADKAVVTQLRDAIQALKANIDKSVRFSGYISPAQLTANTNDWNPAGLADVSAIRFSTDASRNLTGLQGGAGGRVVKLFNVGAQPLVLKNEDAASTAAYRFALPADVSIGAAECVEIQYDSTSSRWRITDKATALLAAASQAEMEAGASLTVYVSPGRQHNHPSAVKFWINFNGTGTIAQRTSYNVTSITDNGVGDYTVTIATDFSSADWVPFSMIGRDTTAAAAMGIHAELYRAVMAAGTLRVLVSYDGGGTGAVAQDAEWVHIGGLGDQ
jgi:hypothetical protein